MLKLLLDGGGSGIDYWLDYISANKGDIRCLLVDLAITKTKPGILSGLRKAYQYNIPANKLMLIFGKNKCETIYIDKEDVWEQLDWCNCLYVPGGNGDILKQQFLDYIDNDTKRFKDVLMTKNVYGGSSAGANLLSNHYYSNDNQRVDKGLGLFNINTFCHYDSSKFRKLNTLIKESKNGIVIPINEGEYVEISFD